MAAKPRASLHQRYFSASVHRYRCGMSGLAFDHEPFVIGWISSMRDVFGFNWNQNQIRKSLVVIAVALALAGCANGRQDRVLGGALIGGGTGALIGGLAGQTAGAALAGGLIGAAAGAIIADATRPGWCYYWRHHRRHYVRC
jgi:hypothetical protein